MQHSDRNPRVSNPHQRHGYSLLELLITLALVIWLGSLSIANLGKIKGQIHRMTCTSHLRQWGLATILFASDHDDWLPMEWAPKRAFQTSGLVYQPPQVSRSDSLSPTALANQSLGAPFLREYLDLPIQPAAKQRQKPFPLCSQPTHQWNRGG